METPGPPDGADEGSSTMRLHCEGLKVLSGTKELLVLHQGKGCLVQEL